MATFVQWHFQSAESKETTAKLALNEKQESNERKRKAKIHLKMAAHAVGKANARAFDRFYELRSIFDDYFLKKINKKYKKKVKYKYKNSAGGTRDDEEITLKYLEYYLEELFNLAKITEPCLRFWPKNATRRADRNRISKKRKELFKNFLKDKRLYPYKSIRDKRWRRKKNPKIFKRKLMENKNKRKLYGNEFFIFLVDLSFNRLENRDNGTVDELGEEADEQYRYIDKSQFESYDSWAYDSTNANYLFYYINKAVLKISHEYKEFDNDDDKLIRWREKKK